MEAKTARGRCGSENESAAMEKQETKETEAEEGWAREGPGSAKIDGTLRWRVGCGVGRLSCGGTGQWLDAHRLTTADCLSSTHSIRLVLALAIASRCEPIARPNVCASGRLHSADRGPR